MTKRSSVSAIGVSSISLLAGVMASLGLALATTALAQTPQPPTPLAPTPLPSAAPPSVTVSEPVSPPPAFVPTAPSARIDLDEVDRRARALMARRGMVGLAVAVIDDGEIVMTRGYGKTAQRLGTPVSETTLFRWASVSKSVAAAAAMSVAEEGHFGLSSPVDAFISTELPESRRALTLEHLLSHRTGLPRNSYDPVVEDGRSETHVKSRLAGTDTVCEPGRCHAYQNVAFDLSTDMVEAALGVPYAGLVPPAKGRFFVASNTGFQIKAQATADTNNSGGFTLANVAYDLNMTVASNSSFDGASSATSFATGASAQDPCSSDVAGGTTGPVLGTVTGANCGVVSAVDALDDLATEAVVYRANRLTAASPGTIAAQSVRFDTTYTFDSDTSQTGVQGYDLSDGTFDYGADVVYTIYAP